MAKDPKHNQRKSCFDWFRPWLKRHFSVHDTEGEFRAIRESLANVREVTARIDQRTQEMEARHQQMADAVSRIANRM